MKSVYKIPLPNGSRKDIEYENDYNFKKRIKIVEDILNEEFEGLTLEEYLNDYWIWLNAFSPYKINYEDKTKVTLERLANFILNYNEAGEGRRNRKKDYKSLRNMNYVYKKELPIGLIVGDKDENIDEESINKKDLHNKDKNSYDLSCKDLDKRRKHKGKTIKNTTFYKIDRIISKEDKIIPCVDSLTNREYYEQLKMSPKDCIPQKEYEIKGNQNKDEEFVLENWLSKSKRNLYNQPIFTIRRKKIKGHKGVINPNKPYSKECLLKGT